MNELSDVSADLSEAEAVLGSILPPLDALTVDDHQEAGYRWWRDQPLGISGCGGTLLGLLALGRDNIFDALLASLPHQVLEADQQLDLIGGLIAPLLQRGSDQTLAMAICAGDHLLARQ